jgi:exoribonuclease R
LVWDIELAETGEGTSVTVGRALVRSRAKLDYATVQRSLDAETAEEPLQLLRQVGLLRHVV